MWTYLISVGAMFAPDGYFAGTGYSGAPEAKNDPTKIALVRVGPIPPGEYLIHPPVDTVEHGPHALPLTPSPENEMYGRESFMIHGDSIPHPGGASKGCIILPRAVRDRISKSGDNLLRVEIGPA